MSFQETENVIITTKIRIINMLNKIHLLHWKIKEVRQLEKI